MPSHVMLTGSRRRAALLAALLAAGFVTGCTQAGGANPAPAAAVMPDDDSDPSY
jgi:outer membrane lipoprotein-sorting protein